MGILDQLMAMMGQQAAPPPQQTLGQMASTGSGAAAHLALQPEYVKYVLNAQEQGQQPIPYEQWLPMYQAQMAQQQAQQQPAPAQR